MALSSAWKDLRGVTDNSDPDVQYPNPAGARRPCWRISDGQEYIGFAIDCAELVRAGVYAWTDPN